MTDKRALEARDHQLRDLYLLTTIAADNTRYELDRICQAFGITIAQYPILWTLCLSGERGGLPMSDLADGTLTRAADTTRLVNRLVESGMVERRADEGDRRKVIVDVTPQGRKVFTAATTQIKEAHRRQFAQFSSTEIEQFLSLLAKFDWSAE